MATSKNTNESYKILEETRAGRHVKMEYSELDITDVIIQLSEAPDEPEAIVRERRFREGEVVRERLVGQPEITELVKDRSWWSANDSE